MPRHINPKRDQIFAVAPYNFVPLPNRVLTVQEGLPEEFSNLWKRHDEFVPGAYSGWIDLDIKTLTPLFIRGAVFPRDGSEGNTDTDPRRSDAFQRPDGTPVIPGSSLRGMIRTLVEILSFSKIQPVSIEKPFFRDVSSNRIGRLYRERIARFQSKPAGGFIRLSRSTKEMVPCRILRVSHAVLKRDLDMELRNRGSYPSWDYQHKKCFVRLRDNSDVVTRIALGDHPSENGWLAGTLVITGQVLKKNHEYVFVDPSGDSAPIPIPDRIWERFHDDDQITQWQKTAFPKDKPWKGAREADGYLRDGEPVFYVTDESAKNPDDNPGGLVFLGRARMFRFPYDKSAYDLVPEHIKEADIDMAEALFGCVRVGAKRHSAIKGRVRFEDAVAVAGGPAWYVDRPFVPKVLSSPKVTTFQHYLTQDGTQGPEHLTSYLEGDYTTIRGFKMYWHRWDDKLGLKQVKEKDEEQLLDEALKGQDTQHTIIRPVKEGVTFRGRVHFTNLAAEELGALLCALDLPEGCRHKLGMGKPLGLGTVSISCQITLIDRQKRYSTWEDNDSVEADPNVFKTAFQKMILSHAENSGETMIEANTGLTRVARLDALYTMLQWDKRPRPEQTRYMVIKGGDVARFGHKNEFRDRPVLTTPHWVAGKAEPNWENDQPKPAVTGKGGRKDKPPRRPSRQTKSFRKDGKSSRRTPGR